MGKQVGTVETGSFSMDYLLFGKGKESLVIIPGLSVQSVMGAADAVVESYQLLADSFTIYLLDQRRGVPDSYPVSEMAQDAFEALRALGISRTHLFGVSLGGMIAMKLAIGHPELVQKLALGSTAACVSQEQYQLIDQWVTLAEQRDARTLYLAFGEAIYPPDVLERARGQFEEAAKTVTAQDLRRFTILAHGIQGFDVSGDLGKIDCPVLAIGSSDDRIFGAETTLPIADILGESPGFEMHLYDSYGHAAYDTAPDYKERLLRFFAA